MRKIKFRAWAYKNVGDSGGIHRPKVEPSNPQMFYDVQDCYDSNWESFGEVLNGGMFKEVIAVMQFTGLKDKNSKEIYEGDILRLSEVGISSMDDPDPFTRVVKWDEEIGGFNRFRKDGSEGGSGWSFGKASMEKYHEVIGNIYENAKLLT